MADIAKSKSCFVVGPIGSADSQERIHSDWVLEEIILPVFEAHFEEFAVTRADKISKPGSINEQIISALLNNDLVIADLTTLNANAFYEIGIRHAVQKPIIHMHEAGQHIPFDIAPFRSIEFSRARPSDIRAARVVLKDFVSTVLAPDYVLDNPVTFSRGRQEFENRATEPEKLIQDQLSSVLERLADIESAQSSARTSHVFLRAPALPAAGNISSSGDFTISLLSGGIISTRQLHELGDELFARFFASYAKVSIGESEYTIRVSNTARNKEGLSLMKHEITRVGSDVMLRVSDGFSESIS